MSYFRNLEQPRRRIFMMASVLVLVVALLLTAIGPTGGVAQAQGEKPTIVLVHGDWADASGWNKVIERLQRKGFTVVAPPNLLRGPSVDAAYVRSFLESIQGPIVLAAHSYGGFIITMAAKDNPNVEALVYIDAFIPAEGESGLDLLAGGTCVNDDGLIPVPVPNDVDLYLRWEPQDTYTGFRECFANGVNRRDAAVLHATQRPASFHQFDPNETSTAPAWEDIPSWSLIGTRDNVIPRDAQEFMSERAGAEITRVRAGHLTLITRPADVVKLILSAVDETS
jgi:pimeloyl-ACP methyl ester carboxylesterase